MQSCWLNRTGQGSCLLFFAGWGMDPSPFRPVVAEGYDLLMLYDYRQLELSEPLAPLLRTYQRLALVAWSMGVWVAARLMADFRQHFETVVALNGTLAPIDGERGIPPQVYGDMLDGFSPATLQDFYASMFVDQAGLKQFQAHAPCRPATEIREELAALRTHYLALGPGADIYTRVYAGSRDRIFPVRTQVRSWGKKRCRIFRGPHFPFYDLGWNQFLGETT
jgi:pimeloyl-[acyl-carrier protein] methyl ester esterase